MRIRIGIFTLVAGWILEFIGLWMRLLHLSFSEVVIGISVVLKIAGLITFVFALLAHPKIKSFLDNDGFDDAFRD